MKRVALLTVAIVTMSSFGFAGGDIEPVVITPAVEEGVSPFYVGLGLSNVDTRNSRESLNFFDGDGEETGDILLMAGYEFNQYIAVEGRYMTSVFGEDSLTRDSWGVYLKPQYPATEALTLYALLGYGGLNVDGNDNAFRFVNLDDTGFQWGVGASYDLNAHVSIFIDYVKVANDMDADRFLDVSLMKVDSEALSVGITYHF